MQPPQTPFQNSPSTIRGISLSILLGASVAMGNEVTVKNDSVVGGSQGNVQAGFVTNESAAAWLTSPCDGNIVAVQVLWRKHITK